MYNPLNLLTLQSDPYTLVCLILFSAMMGGLLIFCFKQKNNHKYREQIALLEARSLRAQMNPHFIFNVLNGLQSVLILKSEQEINLYMGHL